MDERGLHRGHSAACLRFRPVGTLRRESRRRRPRAIFPSKPLDLAWRRKRENKKSPCPTLRSSRDKLGVGVRHTLFPALTLGVLLSLDCQLPDAILHGKRSLRPRSRAVQRLASTGFRVRLFSSLKPMIAPPVCEPGKDTSVILYRVSTT